MIFLELMTVFMQIGLFSIGGAYAAMPLIQEQVVVMRGWMNMQAFADLVTIAEMTPGPIMLNAATFVGMKMAGVPGAVAATFGCILPSMLIMSVLSAVYSRYRETPLLQNVFACLRSVVVALIAGAGVLLFLQAVRGEGGATLDVQNLLLFAAAFVLLRAKKLGPIAVMCLCGLVGLVLG